MNKTSGDFHEQYLSMVADRDAWMRRAGEYETKYKQAIAERDAALKVIANEFGHSKEWALEWIEESIASFEKESK